MTFRIAQSLSAILCLTVLAGCPPEPDDTADTAPPIAGPTLSHELSVEAAFAGESLVLDVTATDDDGVRSLNGWFRTIGDEQWDAIEMTEGDGIWTGTIAGPSIKAPGVEYYFKGTDDSEYNASTFLPEAAFDGPFSIGISPIGRGLPFTEDFEGGGSTIFTLGWFAYETEFAAFGWEYSQIRALSGTQSAHHPRALPADPKDIEDWLVTPALDLRGLETLEVTWFENGEYIEGAQHTMWISAGSADPADGDFEFVQQLDQAPDGEWKRSKVIDVSEWKDSSAAHVAWKYEGLTGDSWTIDDVSIREMRADLVLNDYSWTPTVPGANTTITLDIGNLTPIDAPGLVLTPTIDPSLGSFAGPLDAGDVVANGEISADLVLTIDPAHINHSRLPFSVLATSGTESWNWDLEVLVGEASIASVTFDMSTPTVVRANIGIGDPDNPEEVFPIWNELVATGVHTVDIDVTEYIDFLPPTPGDKRWWLEVEAESVGQVIDWRVTYDGHATVSDSLGVFRPFTRKLYYLPRPPDPTLVSAETTPRDLLPGTEVDLLLTIRNNGFMTSGRTSVVFNGLTPGITVNTPDVVDIALNGWPSGNQLALPLAFTVPVTHNESHPVEFELVVTDEVEQFTIPLSFEVPWPVLSVTGVVIDDRRNGDDDGILDALERTNLEIQLTNSGDLSTFSPLNCTLAQTGGTASATIHAPVSNYGRFDPGETDDDDDFDIELTSGGPGDTLEFALSCNESSGPNTYTTGFVLEVDELPWVFLSPLGDSTGDAINDYSFDFVGGRYRSDGVTLEVMLISDTPFNSGTLFLESWSTSVGAAYDYYQLISQSGVLQMRGYDGILGVFTKISEPTMVEVNDKTVLITIDLAPMGLILDSLEIGFASGFCGGSTYYCDHFPNNWGDPYQMGINETNWFRLRW